MSSWKGRPPKHRNHPLLMLSDKMLDHVLRDIAKKADDQETPFADHGIDTRWSSATLGTYLAPSVSQTHLPIEHLMSTAVVSYAIVQWIRSGEPCWKLDASVARGLMTTDPPTSMMDVWPDIPYDGMYVEVPAGLFRVENKSTGMHDSWGFYLCRNLKCINDKKPHYAESWAPSVLLVGVGEVRSVQYDPLGVRRGLDDAIVFQNIPVKDLGKPECPFEGLEEIWKICLNLLYALKTRHVIAREKNPPGWKRRRDRPKMRKKGILPHTTIHLSQKVITYSTKERERNPHKEGDKRAMAPHVRRGHWRHPWVLDPKNDFVAATRRREDGKILHAVPRWIPMTIIGNPEDDPKARSANITT